MIFDAVKDLSFPIQPSVFRISSPRRAPPSSSLSLFSQHQPLSTLPPHLTTLHPALFISMTHKLPPNLLALFAARPALRYLPPSDHAPEERKTSNIGGVAAFLPALEDYKENVPYEPTESWLQRKDRLKLEKKERQESLVNEGLSRSMAMSNPLLSIPWFAGLCGTSGADLCCRCSCRERG